MVRAVAFWCAVLTAIAVAMPASAHGPTRKKYAETIEINAPARSVTRLNDFFSASECRDLLFHVQEHQMTLPQIAAFIAQDGLAFMDAQLATRSFVAGETFTLADVLLFCFLAFGGAVGQPLNPELKNVGRWYAAVGARASVKA